MITVERVSKRFPGHVQALDDVSFSVPAGTICGVLGDAGAGKSTLARCVGLLDRPESGTVRVGGVDLARLAPPDLRRARRRIGVLPQGESLHRQQSAAANVALPLSAAGLSTMEVRRRVLGLLGTVGLADRATALPDQLSRAQRQRVALARALAAKPAVLLADDPVAGLDPDTADDVLDLLDRVRAEHGVTILLTGRDPDVVRRLCDDVLWLADGRIVERGAVLDLLAQPGTRTAAALLPAVDVPSGKGRKKSTVDYPHRRVVDAVLIGYSALGTLPPAVARFGAELALLGGGITRVGETPVTRVRLGLDGAGADAAIEWLVDQGATVTAVEGGGALAGSIRQGEVA